MPGEFIQPKTIKIKPKRRERRETEIQKKKKKRVTDIGKYSKLIDIDLRLLIFKVFFKSLKTKNCSFIKRSGKAGYDWQ